MVVNPQYSSFLIKKPAENQRFLDQVPTVTLFPGTMPQDSILRIWPRDSAAMVIRTIHDILGGELPDHM